MKCFVVCNILFYAQTQIRVSFPLRYHGQFINLGIPIVLLIVIINLLYYFINPRCKEILLWAFCDRCCWRKCRCFRTLVPYCIFIIFAENMLSILQTSYQEPVVANWIFYHTQNWESTARDWISCNNFNKNSSHITKKSNWVHWDFNNNVGILEMCIYVEAKKPHPCNSQWSCWI